MQVDKKNNFANQPKEVMEEKDYNKILKDYNKKYQMKASRETEEEKGEGERRKELKKVKLCLTSHKDIKQRQKSLDKKKQILSMKLAKGHRRIVSNDIAYSSNAIQIIKIRPETGSNEGMSEKGYAKLASLVSSPFKKGYTLQTTSSSKKAANIVSYKNIIAKHRRVHSNLIDNYGVRNAIKENVEKKNSKGKGKNAKGSNYSQKLSEFRNKFKDLTFSKKSKKSKAKKKKKKSKKKSKLNDNVVASAKPNNKTGGEKNKASNILKEFRNGKYFNKKLNSLFSLAKPIQKSSSKHRRIHSNDFMNYLESKKKLDSDKFKSPKVDYSIKKSAQKKTDLRFKFDASDHKKKNSHQKFAYSNKIKRKPKFSAQINKSEITKKGCQSSQIEKNKVFDSNQSWKMGIKAKKLLNSLRTSKDKNTKNKNGNSHHNKQFEKFKAFKSKIKDRNSLTSNVLKMFKEESKDTKVSKEDKSEHIKIKDALELNKKSKKQKSKHTRGHHRKNAHSMPFSDPTNQIIQILKLPINLGKKDFTMTPDISINKKTDPSPEKSPQVTKFLPRNDSSLVSLIQVNEDIENNEIGIGELVTNKNKYGSKKLNNESKNGVGKYLKNGQIEISIKSEYKYSRNEKSERSKSKSRMFFSKESSLEKTKKKLKNGNNRISRNSENNVKIEAKEFNSRKSSYKYNLIRKKTTKLLNSGHKRSESNFQLSNREKVSIQTEEKPRRSNRPNLLEKKLTAEGSRTLSCSQRKRKSLHKKMRSIDQTTKNFKFEKKSDEEKKKKLQSSSPTMPLILQRLILQNKIRDLFRESDDDLVTTLEFYQFKKLLGEGSFGKVYSAVNILTEKQVAIKCFDKAKVKTDSAKRKIFQEVKILRMLDHQNVTRLLEVFENRKFIFFVMEYAEEGDILKLLKEKGPLDEHIARFLTIQIIHGLQYIHSKRVLHRDIKLDNVLLSKGFIAKICDFGVSCILKKNQILHEQCGTPAYIAPEVIKGDGYSSFQPDVWNLAILLYAMVTGTVPFKSNSIDELHELILIGEYEFPEDAELSEELKDLLTKMLILDPKKRIDLDGMLGHEWFQPLTKHRHLDFMCKKEQEEPDKIVKKLIQLGFPKDQIKISLEHQILNHIYACYHLLREKN